jgi:hypothetical protein
MRLLENGYCAQPEANLHFGNDANTATRQPHRSLLNKLDDEPTYQQIYINRFPPGTMSAMHLKLSIDYVLKQICGNPIWMFRKPVNLFEVREHSASCSKGKSNFHHL